MPTTNNDTPPLSNDNALIPTADLGGRKQRVHFRDGGTRLRETTSLFHTRTLRQWWGLGVDQLSLLSPIHSLPTYEVMNLTKHETCICP